MTAVDLAQLAELPALVRALQARVTELEAKAGPAQAEELVDFGEAAELLAMTPGAVELLPAGAPCPRFTSADGCGSSGRL